MSFNKFESLVEDGKMIDCDRWSSVDTNVDGRLPRIVNFLIGDLKLQGCGSSTVLGNAVVR